MIGSLAMVLGIKCEAVGFRGQCMILSCPCLPTMWVDPLCPFSTHAWHLLGAQLHTGYQAKPEEAFLSLEGASPGGKKERLRFRLQPTKLDLLNRRFSSCHSLCLADKDGSR